MPALGREKGKEEGQGWRERATQKQGSKKGGLGERGGFPAAAAHRGLRHPSSTRCVLTWTRHCSVIPLSPCLLLTEWIEHSYVIKIS